MRSLYHETPLGKTHVSDSFAAAERIHSYTGWNTLMPIERRMILTRARRYAYSPFYTNMPAQNISMVEVSNDKRSWTERTDITTIQQVLHGTEFHEQYVRVTANWGWGLLEDFMLIGVSVPDTFWFGWSDDQSWTRAELTTEGPIGRVPTADRLVIPTWSDAGAYLGVWAPSGYGQPAFAFLDGSQLGFGVTVRETITIDGVEGIVHQLGTELTTRLAGRRFEVTYALQPEAAPSDSYARGDVLIHGSDAWYAVTAAGWARIDNDLVEDPHPDAKIYKPPADLHNIAGRIATILAMQERGGAASRVGAGANIVMMSDAKIYRDLARFRRR